METLKFSTTINAPAQKVWSLLWNDVTYRQWAAPFCEGSYAESDWHEGSTIKFLAPPGDGMISRIKTKIDNKKMLFEHLGSITGGQEIPSPEWAGALEEYTLEEQNGKTRLNVSVDIVSEHKDFFNKKFPEALQKIKELSE